MFVRPVLIIVVVLALEGCGAQPQSSQTPSSVAAGNAQPFASPRAASPSPVSSPAQSLGPFSCQNRSGGDLGSPMQLSTIRAAHQAGFDRVTFEFIGPSGPQAVIPAYELSQQPTTQFVKDPSGQSVTLAGSAGLKVLFRNASGQGTYSGSTDIRPQAASVTQVTELGDFERVLTWGIGLNRASCYRTVELSDPPRLAIDFQTFRLPAKRVSRAKQRPPSLCQ